MSSLISQDRYFSISSSLEKKLAWLIVVCAITFQAAIAIFSPSYNGDIIYYIASSHYYDGLSIPKIHEKTYQQLADVAPENIIDRYNGVEDPYYKAIAADPVALAQQLPFYSVKPLYPTLILVVSKFGVNPYVAANAITSVAAILLSIMLFNTASNLSSPLVGAIGLLLAITTPRMLDLGRLASPDVLSALLLCLAFRAYLTSKLNLFLIALLLSVAARPDNIIICVLAYTWLTIGGQKKTQHLLSGMLCIALYYLQAKLSHNYGLAILLQHSLIDFLPYPREFSFIPEQHALPIIERLLKNWYYAFPNSSGPFFFLLAIALSCSKSLTRRMDQYTPKLRAALVVMAFSIVGHIMVFPVNINRVLSSHYILIIIVGLLLFFPKKEGNAAENSGR